MLFVDFAFLIYAIYIPFFISLYVLELITFIKYWKTAFNSSFFKIFISLAVVNIAACLSGSFIFRINLYPLVNQFYASLTSKSGWLTGAYSSAYYLNCVSEFLGVLLAFNRLSALSYPLHHDRLWTKAWLVGVAGCILIAIAPTWFLFDDPASFWQRRSSDNFTFYVPVASSTTPKTSIWFNMVIVTLTCNGLSTLFYCACLVRLCTFSNNRQDPLHRVAERNLFLVGFFSMICSVPYMALMLVFYWNLSASGRKFDGNIMVFMTYQLPWLADLKYLTPAPLLLITNQSIRRKIIRLFSRRHESVASTRMYSNPDIRVSTV